jgi:hypothetical protein
VVLALAKEAEAGGDHDAAAESWRRLTMLDPLSGRYALGYLKALASRGDRAGALAFARAHESVVQRELETDADPEIRRLEAELRAMPSPVVVRGLTASKPRPPARPDAETGRSEPNDHTPEGGRPAHAPAVLPGTPDEKAAEASTAANPRPNRAFFTRVAAVLAVIVIAGVLTANLWGRVLRLASGARTPTFAVGMIREDGVPDTLRIGGVLTDMLATNLARVSGLSVLANSRLFS